MQNRDLDSCKSITSILYRIILFVNHISPGQADIGSVWLLSVNPVNQLNLL
jgi:hypothetical protein